MLYDHFSNIERYRTLSPAIYNALKMLAEEGATLTPGRHALTENDFVNVTDYETLRVNPVGYEAHKRYIDIQYCLTGEELVAVRRLETLRVTTPYNEERDVMLCEDDGQWRTEVKIGNGYFLILNSNDAHMPQLCIGEPVALRKVIVKIEA